MAHGKCYTILIPYIVQFSILVFRIVLYIIYEIYFLHFASIMANRNQYQRGRNGHQVNLVLVDEYPVLCAASIQSIVMLQHLLPRTNGQMI